MIEQGIVDKIEEKFAFVKIYKNDTCDSCNLCDSGGQADEKILKVNNDLSTAVGDWVQIEIPSSTLIKTAFMIFLFPILAMISGYFFGQEISHLYKIESDAINILTALTFTAISYRLIRKYDRRMSHDRTQLPKMKQILYHKNNKNTDT